MTMPKGWENKNKNKRDQPASNKPQHADYPDDKSYEDAVMQYMQTQGQGQIFARQEPSEEQLRNLEQTKMNNNEVLSRHRVQPDEQLIWRRNLTKGFWNPKVVEMQMITTHGVRINGQLVLDFATINDVQVTNMQNMVEGDYYTYGNENIAMTDGQHRVRSFGDIVFFRQGQMVFFVQTVEDAHGVVALIAASIRGRGY